MNKSKNNTLQKTTVLALSVAMLASVVAFPVSVSAATPKKTTITIPKSFSNKEACLVKLKTYKVASLKKYGDNRIDTRLRSIDNQPEKIQKAYKAYKKAEPVAEKNVSAAKIAEKESTGSVSPPEVAISSREGELLKEVSKTKEKLNTSKNALSKTNSSETASEVICSVMFDLRVFSYLDKKINAQVKVDTARLKIVQNHSRQKAVKKIYEKKKDNKSFAKKIKKNKDKIEKLTNYQAEIDKLNELQSRLDAISIETLNTNNEDSKKELNDIVTESKNSSTNAKNEGKNIDTLYRAVTKAAKSNDKPSSDKDKNKSNSNKSEPRLEAPGVLR